MKFNESVPPKPRTETPEEQNTKKEIIEKAQDERLKLRLDVLKRLLKLLLHGIEMTPVGNFTMGTEAIRGKKLFTGEELSRKDRIMYGLIILHSSIYSTLLTYGIIKGNTNAVMLSAPIYAVTTGLFIIQKRHEVKKDIPESIKKYGDSINEQLLASKKAIEEYGYEKTKELIERNKKTNGK